MSVSSSTSYASPLPQQVWWRRVWFRRHLGIGGLCLLSAVTWWGFRDDSISPVAPEPQSPLIAEKTQQTVRQNGQRLWHFDAAKIELSPDGAQTFAHDVSDGILFRDDKPVLHLSAALVHLENNSNNVDANVGVKAWGNNRFAVSSRLVRWNYEQKLLTCPTNVKAQLRSFSFNAPYLEYKWDVGDLKCNAPIELSAPGVRLSANRLNASTQTRVIELGGNVHLSFDSKKAKPKEWKDLLSAQ